MLFFFIVPTTLSKVSLTLLQPSGWRPVTSAADSGCQTHANIWLHQGQVCLEEVQGARSTPGLCCTSNHSPLLLTSYWSWGSLWILGSQTHLNIRLTSPKPSTTIGSSRALWMLWVNYEFHHGEKGHVYFTLLFLLIKGLLLAKRKAMLCGDDY